MNAYAEENIISYTHDFYIIISIEQSKVGINNIIVCNILHINLNSRQKLAIRFQFSEVVDIFLIFKI